jgi:hypothetical protein
MIVKKFALAAALALTFSGSAHAAAIELVPQPVSQPAPAVVQPRPQPRIADLAVTPHAAVVVPPGGISELPEPEVFLMMLVGLVLIGYRASRDSDEKFK